jgi:ribosomal small subunit protein bTHX
VNCFFIPLALLKIKTMGKGDKRSRKGKVWRGSYGNTRPRNKVTKPAFVPKPKAKKTVAPIQTSLLEELPVLETTETTQGEVKAAKPKKAAAPKKPKAEGEKKPAVKKKAPAEKKDK